MTASDAAVVSEAPTEVAVSPAVSEDAARAKRIEEAILRGEAPIKPEFLLPHPNKRSEPEPSTDAKEPVAAEATGEDDKGKGKGKGSGEPPKKRQRGGQNKAKDRKGNVDAMKAVRASQLCARLAYLNRCDGGTAGGDTQGNGCKHPHDIDAFLAAKIPPIAESCPVLERLGVCPAGLNCRFGGHVVNGKNVDKEGKELTVDSDWATKVPGVGHPVGEANVFPYDMIKKLRRKEYDFSRSEEVVKTWDRYQSGAKDVEPPVGCITAPERKKIDLAGKRVLAPLTTVGNLPFRRLCMRLQCEVTVGEMALASTILEGGPAELSLLRRHESETCYGIQVAGGDVATMAKLAQFVDENVDCDFVDINCGCPLDDVHRRGAGSRLMSRDRALEGIVRCMSSVLKTKHLTLKMRTAHFEDKKKWPEFDGRHAHLLMPRIESWGVSALTLHGRTARQRYTKLADWNYINTCSTSLVNRTPLIGCGDVLSWEEAEEHMKSHGVDSIMIGRGALIKPWIFTEIAEKRHWDISSSERFDMMKEFVHYGLDHWGADARGVETTRRFLLEWLSFSCRYVPIGLLEQMPMKINWRPRPYIGRNDLETKLGSSNSQDWVEITEMLLGKVPEGFNFTPKHKSNAYDNGDKKSASAANPEQEQATEAG